MIERAVDFQRHRSMRCGCCRHEWSASSEWLDRFDQALESCPSCGTDCQSDDRPTFCAAQDDPAHADSYVRDVHWYHTSTHPNWPDKDFNPAAGLTEVTKLRFRAGGSGNAGLERWVEQQKAKALHIGTYESAIENMFRRMRYQGGSAEQFHLYRVRLSPDCAIQAGVHQEPTDFVGDAHLADFCGPGANTYRYVNRHEDPSSISLAIEIGAINAVQCIAVPFPVDSADSWVLEATARLVDAASRPTPLPATALERLRRRMPSVLELEAQTLVREISSELPLMLRNRFHLGFRESSFEADPSAFPAKLNGLVQLVRKSEDIVRSLDGESWRLI